MKYTREVLQAVVQNSRSVAQVLRKLGVRQAGGTHAHIARRIRAFQIDTSHFLGQAANQGENHKGGKKLHWREVLILRSDGHRQKAHVLRRALLDAGREYRCYAEGCPIQDDWLGKELVLHVNHKNGNWLDDCMENLEFLCPNCHSQTPNYCGSKGLSLIAKILWWKKKKGPVVEQADT